MYSVEENVGQGGFNKPRREQQLWQGIASVFIESNLVGPGHVCSLMECDGVWLRKSLSIA
jgi:hypothetical protein